MYQCLKKNEFLHEDGYRLVAFREEDFENIRLWRNAQMKVLRQNKEITEVEQIAYFRNIIKPTFTQKQPDQILFSFLYRDQCIGYGGLVHIDWVALKAEFSFLVDPLRLADPICYHSDFTHFLDLLFQVAFNDLGLHKLHGETYSHREAHIKIMEECGFRREGTLRDHIKKNGNWYNSIMHGLLAGEYIKKTLPGEASSPAQQKDFKKNPVKFGILITSISSKMSLVKAIRNAAERLDCLTQLYGADSEIMCVAQYGVDVFWHCPLLINLTKEEIVNYCQKYGIHIIIPTRDMELPFFAEHKEYFAEHHIRIMNSSLKTVNLCLDKKAFAELLMQKGYLAIPTELSIDSIVSPYYVVKERFGAGTIHTGLKLSRKEAVEYSARLKDPIFQPFIKGVEWSVDLYRSSKGLVKGVVARRRDFIVKGESQVTTTMRFPELEDLCTELAHTLILEGHALFQVLQTEEGRLWVIECNSRFGGASTASLAVGLDSFYWFMLEYLGYDLEKYPFKRLEQEIRQVRYPIDQIIPW